MEDIFLFLGSYRSYLTPTFVYINIEDNQDKDNILDVLPDNRQKWYNTAYFLKSTRKKPYLQDNKSRQQIQ